MRRRLSSLGLLSILGIIGVLFVVSASFAALPPQWNTAIEVPGTPDLNVGGADAGAVSCASPGNCAAGGYYINQWGGWEAFVVDETNGTWGTASEVPGTAALNTGNLAEVTSISCPTAGNCAAGGSYFGSGGPTPFVVSEIDGSWGTAQDLTGMSSLNTGSDGASVTSISCATAGNCVAGGTYTEHAAHANNQRAFVVAEANGTWGTAIEVPGMSTLDQGADSHVTAVSCGTAGNCAVGGWYWDASFHAQAFVIDDTNGTWGTAIKVPGTATLENGGSAEVDSVSCPTAGNCTAGGSYGHYTDNGGSGQPFVVDETNGTWGTAIEVPGADTLNHGVAHVESVSCATAGNCAAGGLYTDAAGATQAFVVDETGGSWGGAIQIPGTAFLNSNGGKAWVRSVSCGAAGACVAAGYYGAESDPGYQAFVASETDGTWNDAIELPGTAGLNGGGGAQAESVSCVSPYDCAVSGEYEDASGHWQAFVDNSAQLDGATTLVPADVGGVSGGTTNLIATLTSGGTGVAGATVSFTLNGASVGSAKTDGDGVATLQNVSLAGIDVGTYPNVVGASFDGDDSPDSASSGSSSLTVYPAGLVGANGVTVNTKKTTIDSFDSSLGAYGASNHGSNALVMSNGTPGFAGVKVLGGATSTQGAVKVASTAHVTGNVKAATTASIQGTVGGTVTENSPSTAFSQPTVAACSPFSPKGGITGGKFTYSAKTGNLTLKKGTVTLASATYCFHTIVVSRGTKLTVNGPVTVNLTGTITGAGHIVNLTADPANLRINTSYSGTGGLVLAGDGAAYMTILAPATAVTISSGSFFGTLFAGTVKLTGSATFHADTP